jgi:hypothetical protein
MYSESDIDGAVAAGAMSLEAATRFRCYLAGQKTMPVPDEEQFRLLTGFNDIFVSIAVALLLAAVAGIGSTVSGAVGAIGVAGTAWLLTEYSTGRRRMALPSILLVLAFVGGVAAAPISLLAAADLRLDERVAALAGAGVAVLTAGAALLHWRRFAVPITVAAGALAVVAIAVCLVVAAAPGVDEAIWPLLLVAGLGVFALAMRWDLSDRERHTRARFFICSACSTPR